MTDVIVFSANFERVQRIRRVGQNELSDALERKATVVLGGDTSEYLDPCPIVGRMQRANVGQPGKVARLEWENRLLQDLLDPSSDVARRLGLSDLFELWLFSLQVWP